MGSIGATVLSVRQCPVTAAAMEAVHALKHAAVFHTRHTCECGAECADLVMLRRHAAERCKLLRLVPMPAARCHPPCPHAHTPLAAPVCLGASGAIRPLQLVGALVVLMRRAIHCCALRLHAVVSPLAAAASLVSHGAQAHCASSHAASAVTASLPAPTPTMRQTGSAGW